MNVNEYIVIFKRFFIFLTKLMNVFNDVVFQLTIFFNLINILKIVFCFSIDEKSKKKS